MYLHTEKGGRVCCSSRIKDFLEICEPCVLPARVVLPGERGGEPKNRAASERTKPSTINDSQEIDVFTPGFFPTYIAWLHLLRSFAGS